MAPTCHFDTQLTTIFHAARRKREHLQSRFQIPGTPWVLSPSPHNDIQRSVCGTNAASRHENPRCLNCTAFTPRDPQNSRHRAASCSTTMPTTHGSPHWCPESRGVVAKHPSSRSRNRETRLTSVLAILSLSALRHGTGVYRPVPNGAETLSSRKEDSVAIYTIESVLFVRVFALCATVGAHHAYGLHARKSSN